MNIKKGRILIVVANPSVSTITGEPAGFWASELTHPYNIFIHKRYNVVIASPNGGEVKVDSYSDPEDESGYSKDDIISKDYLNHAPFVTLLKKTPSISHIHSKRYDAILVAGGKSPVFTFKEAKNLQTLFHEFIITGKIAATICHGTCLLFYLKNADSTHFVKGRMVTGFSNNEEDYVEGIAGRKIMPFRIEDEARKLGANFISAPAFHPYALRDQNLITGQQQHSGGEVARLIIEALEKKN